MRSLLASLLFLLAFLNCSNAQQSNNYAAYHKTVLEIEKLIIEENYQQALNGIEALSNSYEFVFLRDYKIATQLAIHLKDYETSFKFLKLGIANGWTLKEIKKDKFVGSLVDMEEWHSVKKEYGVLRSEYSKRTDGDLGGAVETMYKKDQRFAFKYLFKIGQKAKEKYANKKGVPHTLQQIDQLKEIIKSKGYPGEKLIGEPQKMATILAHHNSLSEKFVKNDTIYPKLRVKLLDAVSRGEMHPYDLALIEDWRIAVKSNRKETGYGYLDTPSKEEMDKVNELRNNLNIRSIGTRNALVDIQNKTGMNFYFDWKPWASGKILPYDL